MPPLLLLGSRQFVEVYRHLSGCRTNLWLRSQPAAVVVVAAVAAAVAAAAVAAAAVPWCCTSNAKAAAKSRRATQEGPCIGMPGRARVYLGFMV